MSNLNAISQKVCGWVRLDWSDSGWSTSDSTTENVFTGYNMFQSLFYIHGTFKTQHIANNQSIINNNLQGVCQQHIHTFSL